MSDLRPVALLGGGFICRLRQRHLFTRSWQEDPSESNRQTTVTRRQCALCDEVTPPYRRLRQSPPWGFLPDDEQPPGAQ